MLPARAVLPQMMKQESGVILTMASDAGKVATPGEVAIGTAMAGVIMFSRALANEAKRSGVRVNCLTPSIVRNTPLYDVLMNDPFAAKIFGKAEKMASLGVVEPEDLAQMATFLASPAAAKITGQAISVNGGISMA
jgi:NAD(P)-dependent dehydrogenase (short-subunit alcohol dehydrogenase family)